MTMPAAPERSRNVLPVAIAVLGALSLATIVLLRLFVFQIFSVPTVGMSPTLYDDDMLILAKRAYVDAEPQRGDVVVVNLPGQGTQWVKRVVGLPGDRIQMVDGRLLINGVAVKTTRLADIADPDIDAGKPHAVIRETLANGRSWRTLDLGRGELDNTAIFQVPPDCYFLIGDNRDDSDDSRTDLGYVKRADVLGKVVERVILHGGFGGFEHVE
ncbi:MAG TPA: signal peptidase I [Rhizomicrobium sp.]|jgi:signal peptidase I|nr:signal peptidase I [Rhizomicrobium sp.]